ncbi:hypothetical protein AB1L88_17955 [Tautonia sp. JC769]|uniref:hypothetical protein n=1 Tax=Tautonia sp. JC769 TaxID=3232135 RepID=UPI003458140A
MRSRRPRAFRPENSPALEERVVLSEAGLLGPVAAQAAQMATTSEETDGFRFPTELPERSQLIDQLEARMNSLFATFAEDFRALRSDYFEGLATPTQPPGDDPGGDADDPIDLRAEPAPVTPESMASTFQQAVLDRVEGLRDDVNEALGEIQGGGGLLNNFGRARVEQLGQELVNIPGIGEGLLNTTEYAVISEFAIADALAATKRFINVYDAALFQTASGFFSGNLRFFRGGERPAEQLAELSPVVGPVLDGLNDSFASFASDFRDSRSDYFDSIGDQAGDDAFEAFRGQVAERAEDLRTAAIEAINQPAGGAGVLNSFATQQLNSLQLNLANVPDAGTTAFGTLGHAALTEDLIGRSVNDLRAMVQLYDLSLFTTAMQFFDANPRFAMMGRPAQGFGTPMGAAGGPGSQSAAQTVSAGVGVGEAGAAQLGGGFGGGGFGPGGLVGVPGYGDRPGLGGSPFSPGVPAQPFFGPRPAGYDPTLGFGGLGNGLVGFGRPVNFGTGFGFGGQTFPGLGPAGSVFGQNLGFGSGGAFGLGNTFGVVAGPGIGTGPGFGGFFL